MLWLTDDDPVGKVLITVTHGSVLEQVLKALQGCLDQIFLVKEHVQNNDIDNGQLVIANRRASSDLSWKCTVSVLSAFLNIARLSATWLGKLPIDYHVVPNDGTFSSRV